MREEAAAIIRKARVKDIPTMHALISAEAARGKMLPKTKKELYALRDSFFVAEEADRVIGCCGYKTWDDTPRPETLVEIISLVTEDQYRGKGTGSRLVQACFIDKIAKGYRDFFTLTMRGGRLFKRLGFTQILQSELPDIIWNDCAVCPKNLPLHKGVCCQKFTYRLRIR